MKISFFNLGCKVNLADISRIGKQFEDIGYSIVDFEEKSDVVLINTCTVTHRADADCRKAVRRALKNSPNAFVGVLGCYAQLKPDDIIHIDGVDAVFGQNEKYKIPELINNFEKFEEGKIFVTDLDDVEFHTSAVSDNTGKPRAVFKIQDGCDYHCTFCTIPFARGKSRSMIFNDIEQSLTDFANQGYKEVILSGINLGEYDAPTGERFKDVVNLIDSLDLGMRYRVSSIEPNLLKPEIYETILNSKNFCPHFHIPLQSGSQEILMKMKRRYRAKNYATLVENIKSLRSDVCIGADVITGFPGETDERFNETYDFIDSLPISYLHVFTYSEREGTPAASFDESVPHDIRKNRTKILRRLSDEKTLKFYESQENTTHIVLPESYNHATGLWKGWTENYVSVAFESDKESPKNFYEVELGKSHQKFVEAKLKNLELV